MINNEDGSVVLSKAELSSLNNAYQGLYDILSDMPSFLGDYFDEQEEYLNVEKWHCFLEGRDFNRSDYIDE